MANTKHSTWFVKDILLRVVLFGAFVGFIALLFTLANDPKTPATIEQVENIFKEQGYDPIDSTQTYKEHMEGNVRLSLNQSLTILSDDIDLTFFHFNDDKSAESLRSYFRSWIWKNRFSVPNIEYESGVSNFAAYTLKAAGKYSLIVRVGNTVVFAISNEESADKIHDIMVALGYFDEE